MRRILGWGWLLALLFGSEAVAKPRPAASGSDARVAAAIVLELSLRDGVRADEVGVVVREGVATLEGRVQDALSAARAVELAGAVLGVRAVVDRIEVEPAPREDADVLSDLVAAWALDAAVDTHQVRAVVRGGVVHLDGVVDSTAERDAAEVAALGIRGVRRVDNLLMVRVPEHRTDPELAADVGSRLRWSALLEDGGIEVAVVDGVVTLSGAVPTVADRTLARELAAVEGVRDVLDHLGVEPRPERPLRKARHVVLPDAEIRGAVVAALDQDPRVHSDDVQVSVDDGVVTLVGEVRSVRARFAAERDAWNTVGVWSVEDELVVVPAEVVPDDDVARRVREAWARDAWLGDEALHVEVEAGRAYLFGALDTLADTGRAIALASAVPGVVAVRSRLGVGTEEGVERDPPVGFLLEQAVRQALYWSSLSGLDRVRVDAEGALVTLTGAVPGAAERAALVAAARAAGARAVVDHLTVRTPPPGEEPSAPSAGAGPG